MPKPKSTKVTKVFDTGQSKVKVRFRDERQARRASFLIKYIEICLKDGYELHEIQELYLEDLTKSQEVMDKIMLANTGETPNVDS